MLTGIGAFVATTTGKIVLGTTVAAASVGGVHAAEIVDVPLLPERAAADLLIVDEETKEVDSPDIDISASDGEALGTAASRAGEDEVLESDDPEPDEENAIEIDSSPGEEAEDEEEGEDKYDNHGSVVSEFARTTELEGCERGQAVAELARSKPKNKDTSDDDSPEDDGAGIEDSDVDPADEDDLTSKCKEDDEDDGEHDEDDLDEDERKETEADNADEKDIDEDEDIDKDEDEDEGPPEGKGHNRDDHPGSESSGGSDD